MSDSPLIACDHCGTFFHVSDRTPVSQFICPKCGASQANTFDAPSSTGSNAIVAVVLLIGLAMFFGLFLVGGGLAYMLLRSPAPTPAPVTTVVAQQASEAEVAPGRGVDRPGDLSFGSQPASDTAAPVPPPAPTTVVPSGPTTPLPAQPLSSSPRFGAEDSNKTPPAAAPNVAPPPPPDKKPAPPAAIPPASVPSDGSLRFGWKPGQLYLYNFSVSMAAGETTRDTRGAVQLTVAATDPTTAADGSPLAERVPEKGSGTALVVAADGYLLTCAHVVDGTTRVEVEIANRKHPARVVVLDHDHDLAILKIDASNLPTLALGDSDKVEQAQEVRAVGFPLSDVLGSSVKITRGTVAGFVDRDDQKLLQVDAAINPGNSGGPLVDTRGQVVGIATSKLSGEEVSNVGFAVPSNVARRLLLANKITSVDHAVDDAVLDGPQLAKRVTPAVAMVHVTIDPRGVGRQKQILLGFSASLTTTNRTNPVPGRFPFPGPPGFPETATDRGQLLVDLAGNVHDYRGNEHLPFLLGPVGQLPIEPLPAHGQTKWKDRRTTTISILRRDEGGPPGMPRFMRPRMPRGPFGQPFGPPGIPGFPGLPGFAEPDEKPVAVVPALETATYQIVESSADAWIIKKHVELKTLAREDGPLTINATGEGQFQFDRAQQIITKYAFDWKYSQTKDGATVTVPVKVAYERNTAPPPANVAPPPNTAAGATPNAVPEAPPAPVPEAQPLADDELIRVLASLANPATSFANKHRALTKLAAAKPTDEKRDEVFRAVQPLTTDSNSLVKSNAIKVLAAWSGAEQVPALIGLLDEVEERDRHHVFRALSTVRDERVARAVAPRILVRTEQSQAMQTLRGLGSIAEDAVLETLAKADPKDHATFLMLIVLQDIGGPKTVETLKGMVAKDQSHPFKALIENAIRTIEAKK